MINITFSIDKLEYFLLILVRITSFIYTAPFYSQANVPQRIKVGFSVFVTIILYNVLPVQNLEYSNVFGYASIIIKESIVGLLLGFSAYIASIIIHFAGKMIDTDIGLAMAQQFDPATKTQTGITGTIYAYLIMMIMIASDMHIFLLNAIVESFSLVPIGGIRLGSGLYDSFIEFMGQYFIIGFRIVLPVFSAILILNCVLGIMAKVAPQMHMFAVGIQLKVITGFLILFATVRLIPMIANYLFATMQQFVEQVMKGLV